MYTNLYLINFSKDPSKSPSPAENFWADEAFQLSGGNQKVYDSIMAAREEFRADQFLLWATWDFGKSGREFIVATHWGDKAYQIDGQAKYDFIQAGNADERSDRFIQLTNTNANTN